MSIPLAGGSATTAFATTAFFAGVGLTAALTLLGPPPDPDNDGRPADAGHPTPSINGTSGPQGTSVAREA